MERRYLVATLALVSTFSIFSREFRSGHLANLPTTRAELMSELKCARKYVTDQIVANAAPFMHRDVPDAAQIVAQMDLPELAGMQEQIEAQVSQNVAHNVAQNIAKNVAEKQCDAAQRVEEQALRAQESGIRAQEIGLRAAERAQERAAEVSARAQERAAEMNARMSECAAEINVRAQEIAARATERAQRAVWNSRGRMLPPNPPSTAIAPPAPLPIDFQVSLPSDFDQQVQAVVDSHVAVKCVRTKVAAQQVRTVMIQRANQNMVKDVRVVISTQDVSGLTSLVQSPVSRSAMHKLGHDVRHLEDHILRTIDRTFATL